MSAIKIVGLMGLFLLLFSLFLGFASAYVVGPGGPIGETGPCTACTEQCVVQQAIAGTTDPEASANYCLQKCCGIGPGGTPTGGTGITREPEQCPAAADGHPQQRDGAGSCYDIYYWDDYCGRAGSCNGCQNLHAYSCIWNGACVPCRSGNCSYGCSTDGGGGGQAQGQGTQTQRRGTTTGGQTTGGNQIPTGTIDVDCSLYSNDCETCTTSGEAECAWSTIFNDCMTYYNKNLFNDAGLKARLATRSEQCPAISTAQADCSAYSDCFTCTGEAGVKRECQWTISKNKCLKYNPNGNFDFDGDDVWLPLLCPTGDCSDYSDCGSCTSNAACVWSSTGTCVAYKEAVKGDLLYSDECPSSTGDTTDTGTTTSTGTTTTIPSDTGPATVISIDTDTGTTTSTGTETATEKFSFCPSDCRCDMFDNILECGSKSYQNEGLIPLKQAAKAAEADGSIMYSTTLNEERGKIVYEFHGFRFGKLFGIFDTDYDLKTFVDAKTGAVERVEQPWWGFLVVK